MDEVTRLAAIHAADLPGVNVAAYTATYKGFQTGFAEGYAKGQRDAKRTALPDDALAEMVRSSDGMIVLEDYEDSAVFYRITEEHAYGIDPDEEPSIVPVVTVFGGRIGALPLTSRDMVALAISDRLLDAIEDGERERLSCDYEPYNPDH